MEIGKFWMCILSCLNVVFISKLWCMGVFTLKTIFQNKQGNEKKMKLLNSTYWYPHLGVLNASHFQQLRVLSLPHEKQVPKYFYFPLSDPPWFKKEFIKVSLWRAIAFYSCTSWVSGLNIVFQVERSCWGNVLMNSQMLSKFAMLSTHEVFANLLYLVSSQPYQYNHPFA